MNKFKYSALAACALTLTFVNAQDKKLRKAHDSFERFEYNRAIHQYERLVASGTTSSKIFQNLADANYLNANYEEAAKWYSKLVKTVDDALDVERLYRYANSLRSINDFKGANSVFEQLQILKGKANEIDLGQSMKEIQEQFGSFEIKNMNINSAASDFAPSFRLDGIVFSTGRDTSGISKDVHQWNKKRFLNLYTATDFKSEGFSNVQRFSDKLNTRLHESSTAFTKDGKTVYFTRNKEKGNNFGRDSEGISRLKLYRAFFKNGKWRDIEELPFNAEGKSVAHPTLNNAEDKLYFASDIEGTVGQSDIFVVDIHADGTFGSPKNLSENINTIARETFPYVDKNDILYFASDGHPGLGGLDVFAVDLKNIDSSKIVNLGEPLNSTADDFSFIMNSETKKGYFASNREGGEGDDDIYALTEVKPIDTRCFSDLSGTVYDKDTNKIVPNATVTLLDAEGKTITETKSNAEGKFTLLAECNQYDHVIVATKEAYEADRKTITTEREDIADITLLLTLLNKGAPIGTDLAKYLSIKPIYFDFNKSVIREDAQEILKKILAYLDEYPDAKVEVRSHTDSRASTEYNMALSQRRAKATVDYLVSKGVNPSRIRGVGFGESQLTNDCANSIKCSEEKHQRNRRSEFILVE